MSLKNRRKKPLRLLLILLACYVFLLIPEWATQLFSIKKNLAFYRVGETIPLLLGPLFWLYILSIYKTDDKFEKKDFLHFLPFILFSGLFLPFYLQSDEFKLNYIEWRQESPIPLQIALFSWFKGLHTIVYLIFCWNYTHQKSQVYPKKAQKGYGLSMLKGIIIVQLVILTLVYLVFTVQFFNKSFAVEADKLGALFISFSFYVYAFSFVKSPKPMIPETSMTNQKYKRSTLNVQDTGRLMENLITHIEEEKPYLKTEYKLSDLSSATSIPSHHISELLNKHHHKTFSEIINTYRVEEAKELLLNPNYQNIKVSSIGYDVGFNSRTTFYFWFKKITNMTPADYQKKYLEG